MEYPENEIELIIWFSQNCVNFGWDILSATSSTFPDSVLKRLIDNQHFHVEFEYYSSSFIEHEHNAEDCDLIICWIDDFPINTGFPIWELSTNTYPISFVTREEDIYSINEHIRIVMENRIKRRMEKPPQYWRKIRPNLSKEQVEFIANNEPKDIVLALSKSGFEISPRTASNWRVYAAEELGIRLRGEENEQ